MSRIALGHHSDDMIETLFLNMFHGGQLKSMPPNCAATMGAISLFGQWLIAARQILHATAQIREYPVIPRNLCGSQDHLQRQAIKTMLGDWEKRIQGVLPASSEASHTVAPSQLADRSFLTLLRWRRRPQNTAGSPRAQPRTNKNSPG